MDSRLKILAGTGATAVELGCGAGNILDHLEDSFATRIGLDRSTRRLEEQGASVPKSWEFRHSDLNDRFPLPDASADLVIANQVIEHIVDPFHFASEINRILAPRGRCLITTPNVRYLRNIAQIAFSGYGPRTAGGNERDGSWDDGHLHYFTHKDLHELFAFTGFSTIESMALIDTSSGGRVRRLLDRYSRSWIIREFLSGCILVHAVR